MTGNTQKRNGPWRVVLELGEQAALRCPTCRKRYWRDEAQPRTCPAEHGELEEVVTRRQELMPDKYATKKEAEKALRDDPARPRARQLRAAGRPHGARVHGHLA